MTERVHWRGVTLDARAAEMMTWVDANTPGIPITPTQGSYSDYGASAGTHSGGGAIDLGSISSEQMHRVVEVMRCGGWAAWVRHPGQSDWPWHIHGIAVQPGGKGDRGVLSSAAHSQVIDYYEGRNGLASGAPDDGPRGCVGVVWESVADGGGNGDEDMSQPWAVNMGPSMGWWATDFVTYRCGISNPSVLDEGKTLGAWRFFAGGNPVGQGWHDHINKLPLSHS
jgi:hypothetical protein